MKSFWQEPLRRQVFRACRLALMLNGFIVFAEWYAVSPIGYGGQFSLFVANVFVLPLLLAALAVPLSLCLLPWRRTRRQALTMLVCGVLYVAIGLPLLTLSAMFRVPAFERLAERSASMVAAIHQSTEDQGAPPLDLDALVPDYLPAVPRTGMPAYPHYRYSTGHDTNRWDGNPWVLCVSTPSGGINFDIFLYLPMQNYPNRGYGGVLRRIGDWAYVHE